MGKAAGQIAEWVDFSNVEVQTQTAAAYMAAATAAEIDRKWNIEHPTNPRQQVYQIHISRSIPSAQGDFVNGGGIETAFGRFTTSNYERATFSFSINAVAINYSAFYSAFLDDPMMATIDHVIPAVTWSLNPIQLISTAPQLPGAFNAQGKIFEQKFNNIVDWMQNTWGQQAQQQIQVIQQVVISAPDSPGDLIDTGTIDVGGTVLDQGHIINAGDGGR